MVDKAVVTVTVTGTQLPAPAATLAPDDPLSPDDPSPPADPPAPAETADTVTYWVEVSVPVTVVVGSASLPVAPAPPDTVGRVAYTVAVLVCGMVVTITVVLNPEPSVYERTTPGEPVASTPLFSLAAVGAAVTPVPSGMADAGIYATPPDATVAEYEAWAAELADSASAIGQTVWNTISTLLP